jgi:hypothetical protein
MSSGCGVGSTTILNTTVIVVSPRNEGTLSSEWWPQKYCHRSNRMKASIVASMIVTSVIDREHKAEPSFAECRKGSDDGWRQER